MLICAAPHFWSVGAHELRHHASAVRRDGVDRLLILHRLAQLKPDHHPRLRTCGVAILTGAKK